MNWYHFNNDFDMKNSLWSRLSTHMDPFICPLGLLLARIWYIFREFEAVFPTYERCGGSVVQYSQLPLSYLLLTGYLTSVQT